MSDEGSRGAAGKVVRLTRKKRKCPMCSRPAVGTYRPFCSKRCADADLGRWLGEGYRIPGEPAVIEIDGDDEGGEGSA
jgi:endogenous inhibitor of DNA gyrase (YacG/DUF329 family)